MSVETEAESRECTDQSFTMADSSGLLPHDGALADGWPSPQVRAFVVTGARCRQQRGPQLDWMRVTGTAFAILVNGFAVLYVSLPPSSHSRAPLPLEWMQSPRHALTVEFIKPDEFDPPETRDPPSPVNPIARRPAIQTLPKVAIETPPPTPELATIPLPRVRWSVSELTALDEATPKPEAWHVPETDSAQFDRQPAITYEPTRFADAWQSLSLSDRARQTTFSYARFCALSDEMKQIRGCSRDERNADASAMRGERVNIALRPDAAVD